MVPSDHPPDDSSADRSREVPTTPSEALVASPVALLARKRVCRAPTSQPPSGHAQREDPLPAGFRPSSDSWHVRRQVCGPFLRWLQPSGRESWRTSTRSRIRLTRCRGPLPREFVAKATQFGGIIIVSDAAPPTPLPIPRRIAVPAGSDFGASGANLTRCHFEQLCARWDGARLWSPCTRAKPRVGLPGRTAPDAVRGVPAGHGGEIPQDYKFWVFDGRCRIVAVDSDRFTGHRRHIFSRQWELLPYVLQIPEHRRPAQGPAGFEEMQDIAERLGRGIDFVRVRPVQLGRARGVRRVDRNYPAAAQDRFDPA